MPISISGLSSGLDTDGIIDKLVKIEREPIRRLERRKKEYNFRIKALELLGKKLNELNKSAKELYGFRASYSNTKAISSNESVLTAKGSKLAQLGSKKIEVDQVASAHRIATDSFTKKAKIGKGKFKIEVNGESYRIKFRGGRLQKLKDTIDEAASGVVNTSYIKTQGDNHILIIQSKTTGEKGLIKLSGDRSFLKSIGLISGEKRGDRKEVNLVFDRRYFSSYIGTAGEKKQNGKLQIDEKGKSVSITGTLWQEYVLPVEAPVKKDTILEFRFSHKIPKEPEIEKLPFRLEFGPKEEINIKGVKLNSYNVSRLRELEREKKRKKFDNVFGIGVVSYDNGKRTEKIYKVDKEAKGKQEIPVGKDFQNKKIKRVIFYCNDGTTSFSDTIIATPIKDKGLLEPKNVISQANDAKLKLDGINIVRDKNNDLNDIIPGITLNLKRKSNGPIELTIEPDVEGSVENINNFVKAYNKYIEYHADLIKTGKASRPGDYKSKSYKKGVFVGDITLMRLEGNVKKTVSGAYRTVAENPIRMLAQIGITTGKIGTTNWASIKEGKLMVEESILSKSIRDNPEGVRMFFGVDTDGDNRIDSGMAYTLVKVLRPYVQTGNNIITSKMDLEKSSIKLADERIERHEMHIVKYEERLRRKFAKMEQSVSRSKSQGNWLKNQTQSQGSK